MGKSELALLSELERADTVLLPDLNQMSSDKVLGFRERLWAVLLHNASGSNQTSLFSNDPSNLLRHFLFFPPLVFVSCVISRYTMTSRK